MDGRAFIRAMSGAPAAEPPATDAAHQPAPHGVVYQHAVMNLPSAAIEFVDAFRGAFEIGPWEGRPLPTVHCYTFQRAGETQQGTRLGAWILLLCGSIACLLRRVVGCAAETLGRGTGRRAGRARRAQRCAKQGYGVHFVCGAARCGIRQAAEHKAAENLRCNTMNQPTRFDRML